MIDWTNVLSEKNFYTDPGPHYRIYNFLPDKIHDELYNTYLENRSHRSDGMYDVGFDYTTLWKEFLQDCFNSIDIVPSILEQSFSMPHQDCGYFLSSCALAYHNDIHIPGELIRDWHRDGDAKYFNMIYYLGNWQMTYGNIELKDMTTQKEKSYEYTSNSAIIWSNKPSKDHDLYHQFRQSGNQERRTVYVTWAPNEEPYIKHAINHHSKEMQVLCKAFFDSQFTS
jgi:hypothetical protein